MDSFQNGINSYQLGTKSFQLWMNSWAYRFSHTEQSASGCNSWSKLVGMIILDWVMLKMISYNFSIAKVVLYCLCSWPEQAATIKPRSMHHPQLQPPGSSSDPANCYLHCSLTGQDTHLHWSLHPGPAPIITMLSETICKLSVKSASFDGGAVHPRKIWSETPLHQRWTR